MTDETQSLTRAYWVLQNPRYAWTMDDPDFVTEQIGKKSSVVTQEEDYRKYLPSDPSDPRAWIPYDVRFAKRKDQGFRCAITGWHELDWVRDKQHRGPIRLVGILTVEHVIAGSKTADDTIKMVCGFVNSKKGNKRITYDEMRDRILGVYELAEPPDDLKQMLVKYSVKEYKI